ncbi:hypothetical protein SAMN04244573_01033 [Azotobacter beijerinckii]|uniref:Dephospho-CoA kinase n=1 Tax=Azotobacter beijerinckii TaxID=170623 RepID=A0A1H9DCX3_9GAMM|nr:deoxynucleotide monophosphate kinase [Azotobacter beijerinckii]SEQ10673.1 hypothetical protein SAMN04244573_01033 [Azotobacter beijerinckii]
MSTLLIGLTGAAHSGKSTAARELVAHYGFLHYAFAQPLKAMLAQGLNLSDAQLEGAQKEAPLPWLGKSPRELLQTLGTEWGRHLVHPELWLRIARQNLGNLADCHPQAPGIVISDVRYEDEAEFVRQRGGVLVHILRPDAPPIRTHATETGIAIGDNDLVIHNDSDPDGFRQRVRETVQRVAARAGRRAA